MQHSSLVQFCLSSAGKTAPERECDIAIQATAVWSSRYLGQAMVRLGGPTRVENDEMGFAAWVYPQTVNTLP